jgi:hypothetical protein
MTIFEKSKRTVRIFAALTAFTLALIMTCQYVRGEPGGDQFLEKREVTTSMFIAAIVHDGPELTGLQLVYIPPELQSRCWKKSLDQCASIVRNAAGMQTGGPLPAKLYDVWVTRQDASVRSQAVLAAAKNKFIENFLSTAEKGPHEYYLPTIERHVKLRALVRWECWTNGDGIHGVLDIPSP